MPRNGEFIPTAPPPPYDFVNERAVNNQHARNPGYQSTVNSESIVSENETLIVNPTDGCRVKASCKFFLLIFCSQLVNNKL